ncbi:hypothetical protein PC118_g13069 [Phytophthora cactorum]|uniref:Uncharacterized protein n=1 Tax=Phytophthora cactorum TaxID=29920 RepID=A0A8T1FY66_9STRA|nr:hypothetical protein PC118_g13069 [Phytophthora cactorum]
MTVDALVVEGAADEFLLGEDWVMRNGVKIDFTSCEMKWYDGDDKKIVPFRCTTNWQLIDDRTVRMRLVKAVKVVTSTCRRLELAVAPPEDTTGLFMPARRVEPHLLLAPTLTTSCLVYLDDVIAFTKGSVACRLVELVAVLERLSQAWLSLKASDEGQILDDEIRGEQARDKTVKKLLEKSKCNDRAIVVADGIVCIRETDGSSRVLLPTALWVKVLKENHDSERKDACATVGTVVQGLRAQEGEDEEVISPLRSQGIGNQGDRWAPDVVGPRSITPNGNRNVVAAVD